MVSTGTQKKKKSFYVGWFHPQHTKREFGDSSKKAKFEHVFIANGGLNPHQRSCNCVQQFIKFLTLQEGGRRQQSKEEDFRVTPPSSYSHNHAAMVWVQNVCLEGQEAGQSMEDLSVPQVLPRPAHLSYLIILNVCFLVNQ